MPHRSPRGRPSADEFALLLNGLSAQFLPGPRPNKAGADYQSFQEAFDISGGTISTTVFYERDPTLREMLSGTLLDNSVGATLFAASGGEVITAFTGESYKVDALRARYGTEFAIGEYGGLALSVGSLAAGGTKLALRKGVEELPDYLRRIHDGIDFDRSRRGVYDFDELHIVKPGGSGYYRLDGYNEVTGEIVSRKFTQLSGIQESTALSYLREIPAKYPRGAEIGAVPTSKHLGGLSLRGNYILEVPVQKEPIPQSILDSAARLKISIRDIDEMVY